MFNLEMVVSALWISGLLVMVGDMVNTTKTTTTIQTDARDDSTTERTYELITITSSVTKYTTTTADSTQRQSATTINATTTTTTTSLSSDTDKLPNNVAIIAGVVCSVGVFIIAFIVLFVICWKRRRSIQTSSHKLFKPARNSSPTSLVPEILTADDAPTTHAYASIVPLSTNSIHQQNVGAHQNFASQAPAIIYAELSEGTASSTVAPPAAESPTHYAQIVKSTVTAGEQEERDVTFQGAYTTLDSGVEYSQLFSSATNGKRC